MARGLPLKNPAWLRRLVTTTYFTGSDHDVVHEQDDDGQPKVAANGAGDVGAPAAAGGGGLLRVAPGRWPGGSGRLSAVWGR
jgi:hypothetical protein